MTATSNSRAAVLICLAFVSGCCSLAYEVLYLRALTTLLGDMLYIHAALLSTFLVGIGLGARWAHRWLGGLWLLEALTGLYALIFPWIAGWFAEKPVLIAVTGSPALSIVSTAAFLVLPSLLIGFSIPLFSAYLKEATSERLAFERTYAIYNLGACLSVLIVELVLIRVLGIRESLATVGTLNLLNGTALLAMRAAPARAPTLTKRRFPAHVLAALALASIVSGTFQVFVLKLSYLVFAPHRENFAVGLSITLLGIFLGARLAARVRIRFETCLLGIPLLLGGTYAAWDPLVRLHLWLAPWAQGSDLLILLEKFAIGCLLALGPMVLFGAMLPALMRSERQVASESGQLLFVSSLANATGYLLYVLVGHPLLSTGMLLATLAFGALLASLVASGFRWRPAQWGAALAGIAAVGLLLSQWHDRNFYLAQVIDRIGAGDDIVTFKSGPDNVTLVREADHEWLSYNGHASINPRIGRFPRLGESVSGVIPALVAPRLGNALVLGFGAGFTAGVTSLLFEHTDVVEINRAFYKLMPLMQYAHLGIDKNPRASLHVADGRAFLIGKDGKYDAIVNAIPAPTYFSASKIYTVEFYERVRRSLKPDGIFVTWLAVPDMSSEGLLMVLSALHRSFAHCNLYIMSTAYYETACSNTPLRIRRFSELSPDKRIIGLLRGVLRIFDPDELFEDIRLSDDIFARFTPKVRRENTDDHPVFEFALVRDFQKKDMGQDLFLEQQQRFGVDPVRSNAAADSARLLRRAAAYRRFDRRFYERDFAPFMQGVFMGDH